jgi:predicted dehydrogenase
MKKKIRWGILGCGKIANKFATDLQLIEDAELVAVASRDVEKGKTFASLFNARLSFNTYEALASCGEVDVIYIATPHGFHLEHTSLCLQHFKAVLCEKPMAINSKQVKEMIDLARKQKVFLMEAFWTKFLPQYQKVVELIQAGEIGTIKMIDADFGFKAVTPTPQRLYDVALGGGALLDVGIYPVFLALSLLGRPNELHAVMSPYESGVDEQIAMTLKFKNGALAVLNATFAADTPVEATIVGTEGYIRMANRFHNATSKIELVKDRQPPVKIKVHREEGYGYQFEARHVGECLRAGQTESPIMGHADSLLLIETLDRLRASCGITYAVD